MTPHASDLSYRREAFKHAANLSALAAIAAAGLWEPRLWALAVPIELAFLWIVPDLPTFRSAVVRRREERAIADERARLLDRLWGLTAVNESAWAWGASEPSLDDRVKERGSREFEAYLEMRATIAQLRGLVGMRAVYLTEAELRRCEEVINGYLRMLIALEPLERAISSVDLESLELQIASIERQIEAADGPIRAALDERRSLLAQQRARVPRLTATLQLFEARAAAIAQQLRDIHAQALTDPGMNVTEMLDAVLHRHEVMADPLLQEASLDEFLSRPSVKDRLSERRFE